MKILNMKLGFLILLVYGASGFTLHDGSNDIINLKYERKEFRNSGDLKEFPCPDAAVITPCVCTALNQADMEMDCSSVTSEEELKAAFSAEMPFFRYKKLTMNGNTGIKVLDGDSFGLCSFENVEITGTTITDVLDSTFARSETVLQELRLSNNAIEAFFFDGLTSFQNLTLLDLSGNVLTTGLDITSQSLVTLDLSDNPGLQIDSLIFGPCPNLATVNIRNCNLDTILTSKFAPLTGIVSIDLSDNAITSLEEGAVNPTAENLEETLDELKFNNNPISTVAPNFVTGYSGMFKLSMSGAELIEFDQGSWGYLVTTVGDGAINIDGNPLRCGCDMEWIFQDNTRYYEHLEQTATCRDGFLVADIADTDVYDYHCNY